MVLIANQEKELFEPLNARLTSRLQTAIRIRFDRYSVDELVGILRPRVRLGLHEDAVTSDQLKLIANAAAGDARVGIETLRVAVRHATHEGLESVSDDIIRNAVSEAKSEIRQRNVDRLNSHQQILYDIITEHEEIHPSKLYDEYRTRASNPRSERMVRNYLRKLVHYNLIEANGKNRGRVYRVASSE
ncbi:Cdc6/Cdc18 family protein [Haloarcula nitratireducens]|uniref:Orc1/cdc6 family replication initiation protein n=1 Tax=Haloarcula nitratireducens TaxID=2487749 RepID=A0AAW4PH74_9EURY|nr:orc1/cdc6 family replication initiation protein [Halomicroarcula nitratireducens]MBX0297816.1 orc1/cdc6 family replication initiation protein [Halomicroarcula nitratireducens]